MKSKYLRNISSDVLPGSNETIDLQQLLDKFCENYDFDYEDSLMLFAHRICKELLLPKLETAYKMLREYVKFMAMLCVTIKGQMPEDLYPKDVIMIPSAKVLAIWRLHILYSSKYIEFCKKITGKRLHLNLNKFFTPEILNNEENMLKFREKYETCLKKYRFYYRNDGLEVNPIWPDFFRNTVEYVFRFCLFPESYKTLNSKHDFEGNNLIENLLSHVDTLNLETFRIEVLNILNKYKESTGMTNESMQKYWKQHELERSSLPKETLASQEMSTFFAGNIPIISEIRSNPVLYQQFVQCVSFRFPENFHSILSHEMLLDFKAIERIVLEYRRFLFLRCYRPNMVFTPSEEVDIVWHLHLNFTFPYMKTTQELLGYEYLHNPTKGGRKELEKHNGLYEGTLDVYQRLFGDSGRENWPEGGERFSLNPYWFVLTEKYLDGRLETKPIKKQEQERAIVAEEKGILKNFQILTCKERFLMLLFILLCVIVGGYIGHLVSNKGGIQNDKWINIQDKGGD